MANGLSLQELRSWLAGSLNVSSGANVAINSTALFGFSWSLYLFRKLLGEGFREIVIVESLGDSTPLFL